MTGRLKQLIKRYAFFLTLLLIDIVLALESPETGREVTSLTLDSLFEMLAIIPPIFLLLGLMDVWVPRETIMRYMGEEAGLAGGILAFVLGSFSAGPLYASFPVAMAFLKKGVSLTNVFIIIGAWSTTKVPMMLFEITQLGATFACCRFGLSLIAVVVMAIIMDRTTSKEEVASMREAPGEV